MPTAGLIGSCVVAGVDAGEGFVHMPELVVPVSPKSPMSASSSSSTGGNVTGAGDEGNRGALSGEVAEFGFELVKELRGGIELLGMPPMDMVRVGLPAPLPAPES